MDNLKYSVTFTLNVHRFGSMRKKNIEKPLPWLRTTCCVVLKADITAFCWIACSFKIEFELVTLATQLFRTSFDGVGRTQFFCYICALDVGRVEHLRFSTIFRVRETYTVTKMVNMVEWSNGQWFVMETSRGKKRMYLSHLIAKRANVNLCGREKIRIYVILIRTCNIDSSRRTYSIR